MPKLPAPTSGPLIVALAYDQLATFEFAIAAEVFGMARPEMGAGWYRFAAAGVDQGEMRALGGLRFGVDGDLRLLNRAHTIIIPGWRGVDTPVPERLIRKLKQAHHRGARLVSFCSGVFVLAAAGLLDGKAATTHWRYAAQLSARYPAIKVMPDVLYTEDGTIFTAAGTAAGLDLSLHLIRQDFGAKAANLVARRLVIPTHRAGGQAQYIQQAVPPLREAHVLSSLLDEMRQNLAADYSIERLAARAHMSQRTFLRRFEAATGLTAARWLLKERLALVCMLLETTAHSIDKIAALSGFGTAATLRHHFRQQLTTTPAAYRLAFGAQAAKADEHGAGRLI